MGIVLEATPEVAPGPGEPFLVVDPTLAVAAISVHAAGMLGVEELHVLGRSVLDLLVPGMPGIALERPLENAATGSPGPHELWVRDARRPSVRYRARVGACGEPTAALVVLARVP
jgi:hypothetical protein